MTQAYVKVEEFWAVEAERDRLLAQVDALRSKITRREESLEALRQELAAEYKKGFENAALRDQLAEAKTHHDETRTFLQQKLTARGVETADLKARLLNAESSLRAKMNAIAACYKRDLAVTQQRLADEMHRPITTINVLPVLTKQEEKYREELRAWLAARTTHETFHTSKGVLAALDRVCPPPAAKAPPTDADLANKVTLVMGVLPPGRPAHKVLEEVADALRARSSK